MLIAEKPGAELALEYFHGQLARAKALHLDILARGLEGRLVLAIENFAGDGEGDFGFAGAGAFDADLHGMIPPGEGRDLRGKRGRWVRGSPAI